MVGSITTFMFPVVGRKPRRGMMGSCGQVVMGHDGVMGCTLLKAPCQTTWKIVTLQGAQFKYIYMIERGWDVDKKGWEEKP